MRVDLCVLINMKHPIKRKKKEQECPINARSLLRRYERGDKRIDAPKIIKLYDDWVNGKKVPWRKLSKTFIKPGPRP